MNMLIRILFWLNIKVNKQQSNSAKVNLKAHINAHPKSYAYEKWLWQSVSAAMKKWKKKFLNLNFNINHIRRNGTEAINEMREKERRH